MRLTVWLSLVVTATATSAHVLAQSVDEELRVYAVNVVKTPPLEKQFTGYGIYLGNGKVITAAHVVGHWPAVTRPRVLICGQDLPAQVLKIGSLETVDLACCPSISHNCRQACSSGAIRFAKPSHLFAPGWSWFIPIGLWPPKSFLRNLLRPETAPATVP